MQTRRLRRDTQHRPFAHGRGFTITIAAVTAHTCLQTGKISQSPCLQRKMRLVFANRCRHHWCLFANRGLDGITFANRSRLFVRSPSVLCEDSTAVKTRPLRILDPNAWHYATNKWIVRAPIGDADLKQAMLRGCMPA